MFILKNINLELKLALRTKYIFYRSLLYVSNCQPLHQAILVKHVCIDLSLYQREFLPSPILHHTLMHQFLLGNFIKSMILILLYCEEAVHPLIITFSPTTSMKSKSEPLYSFELKQSHFEVFCFCAEAHFLIAHNQPSNCDN